MKTIEVGQYVRDVITGYEGVAVCRSEWLHGCVRISVQAQSLTDDGEPTKLQCFDEPQLEVLGETKPLEKRPDLAATGGGRDDTIATSRNN